MGTEVVSVKDDSVLELLMVDLLLATGNRVVMTCMCSNCHVDVSQFICGDVLALH